MIERKRPAYLLIKQALQAGIEAGRVPVGAVLSESALASIFRASRSPVRQALAELEHEGVVHRFDGRGVVVGGADSSPIRLELTPAMFDLGPSEVVRSDAWENLYYDLERSIIHRSVFGRARVNELALARHYGVGRTVARNLLIRSQAAGLLSKEDNAHWYIVALTDTRVRDLYELRIVLEPLLVKSAASGIPGEELNAMERRLHSVASSMSTATVNQLDELENDLHVQCLSYGRNLEVIEALKRTRCSLVVGKHIQAALAKHPQIDPFTDEHLAVIRALKRGDGDSAAAALSSHLVESGIKAVERLEAFRAVNKMPHIPFVLD
ncbi:GntR family transcriptional regulator [Microvirga sp. TS319]|uniref:GntR family transcriptional regulator n=1 Tax=Microvirga sp. TS319 TaxID=3241165 RepID=UPI00351A4B63